jgi:hypothetical protein
MLKEEVERINDTSKMQGMIINMFNRNKNNDDSLNTVLWLSQELVRTIRILES